MANTEILLESGTNEIEIMEFTIDGECYGINVAKVREIMMSNTVKPVPRSHNAVEGIFKPRDIMLTVVDLPAYLSGIAGEKKAKDLFMITNFNKLNIAFRVHSVVGIRRISWRDIQKPDETLNTGDEGIATGIAQYGGRLVTILDFEKIVAEIAPNTGINLAEIDSLGERKRSEKAIILAEDSALLSRMITEALLKSGFVNIKVFNNGEEAWDYLKGIRDVEHLDKLVSLIITDIEMPIMDGHRLTKLVKDDSKLKGIPLIIFSSLISEEMRVKGKLLGADEQLTKPEIGNLVHVMDALLKKKEQVDG